MAGNRKLPLRLKNPHTWNRCSDTSSKPVLVSTLEMETRAKRKRSEAQARPGAIIFRCEKCDKEFKFRMSMCNDTYNVAALEVHMKKCKESSNISDEGDSTSTDTDPEENYYNDDGLGGEYIEYDTSIKAEATEDVIEIE